MAYGLASVIGKVAALATVPFLTRQLTPEGYGLADLATAFAAFLTVLVRFGGDIPAARFHAASGQRSSVLTTYVVTTAAVSTALALLLLPASGIIADRIWRAPDTADLAALSLLLVPISATQVALINVQRLQGRPVAFVLLATVDLGAQLALAVLLVAIGFGPRGVLLGFVGGSVIGMAAGVLAARGSLRGKFDAPLGFRILREGTPFVPATVAFLAADYAVRYVIVSTLGQAGVGYFGVAMRLASVMTLLAASFSLAWGPYGLQRHLSPGTSRLFGRVLLTYSAVTSLASVLVAAAAPEIVLLISGNEYGAAASAVPPMLLSAAFSGIFYILLVGAGITGRGRVVAAAAVLGATAQVIATTALLEPMGFLGIGAAALMGRVVSLLVLGPAVWSAFDASSARFALILAGSAAAVILLGFMANADQLAARMAIGLSAVALGAALVAWMAAHDGRLTTLRE